MSGIIGQSPNMKSGMVGSFPVNTVVQIVTDTYNGGGTSHAITGTNPGGEVNSNFRFSIVPRKAGSKIIVSYESTKMHVNNKLGFWAIGHEVTASSGTATGSTMTGQLVTVGGHTQDADAYFHYGKIADYGYDANYNWAEHSPSYTVGQKIWYSPIGYSSGSTWYFTNNGDVRFQAIEIQG